jgi:hypothetical protein
MGNQINELYQKDESSAWYQIMLRTGGILPCPDCKKHYANWLSEKKINLVLYLKMSYNNQAEFVRHWFFDLHNNVNIRNNKLQMPYDIFIQNYMNQKIDKSHIDTLAHILFQYTKVSGYLASPANFAEWKKYIAIILSFV